MEEQEARNSSYSSEPREFALSLHLLYLFSALRDQSCDRLQCLSGAAERNRTAIGSLEICNRNQ